MNPRIAAIFFPLLLAAATVPGACHRQEFRTIVVNLPQMRSAACGELIRARLVADNERSEGRELLFVREAKVDAAAKRITVVYNSEVTAGYNVLHAIAAMGFDCSDAANPARAATGNEAARKKLPADCR